MVRKLGETVSRSIGHKLFFDNWYTTLDLIHLLDEEGILFAGIIHSNHLQECPPIANKHFQKHPIGSFDYKTDDSSGTCIVKWNDDSVVQLAPNFVSTHSIHNVLRWNKFSQSREEVECPNVVIQYNKSMGGVELADMLLNYKELQLKQDVGQ